MMDQEMAEYRTMILCLKPRYGPDWSSHVSTEQRLSMRTQIIIRATHTQMFSVRKEGESGS
uniref:Uncharacterized protein n=1 Tax=Brassica oleracea var. oleracea TaxID=109376 RepID=A0A0D2ZXG8_BRAOL